MILFLIQILLLPWMVFGADSKITASGGGVVKPGDDLVLTYNVGQAWDRCFWFWYEHHSDVKHCSYDMTDATKGTVKPHKCKPANLSSTMEYTGKTNKECTVTIHKVTDADNCTWAARLEDELLPTTINVTVASPVKNVTINVPKTLELGVEGELGCDIIGGRPAPRISFEWGNETLPLLMNDTQKQEPDEDGIYESRQEAIIKPSVADHGKKFICSAGIFDGNNKLVYDLVKDEYTLNVTFPPQPVENKTAIGYNGKNITLKIEFQANPTPTVVKFVVILHQKAKSHLRSLAEETSGNKSVVTLLPGDTNDKYNFPKPEVKAGVNITAELTILKLDEVDGLNEYHLEVENSLGSKDYFVTLKIDGQEPNTTTTEEPETTEHPELPVSGGHGGIYAAVILVILIALAVLAVLVYKRMHRTNETAPLQSQY